MSEVFDQFAKWTARGSSRRDVLRYLGGFLGGGFLMGAFSGCKQLKQISAACQAYCAACSGTSAYNNCLNQCDVCEITFGTLCPSPIGTPLSSCPSGTVVACCYASGSCCASGNVNYCAYESSDANNCGGCGVVCASGVCCNSGCCPTTLTKPGCCFDSSTSMFACTDLDSDVNNCGSCGNACSGSTPNCVSGACSA